MKTLELIKGSVILAGLVGLSACGGSSKDEAAIQDSLKLAAANEVIKVDVTPVRLQDVAQIEELTATVKAYAENDIAPQQVGRIKKIYTEVGHHVSKGQLLIAMDQTSLLQTKTQMVNQEADYKRTLALMKAGGASQQQVDQLKTQLDVTRQSYANQLENVNLKAPISGVITARNNDAGDMYSGGQPILTINQINPVKIKVSVSEENFSKIKQGQNVSVKLDAFGDKTFTGHISIIYPTMDEASRTFPVEIQISNSNSAIRPGMFARATFNLGSKKRILVPAVSVQKMMGSGDRFVYTSENGHAVYHKIELGRRLEDKYEVISGLEDGANVITSGMASLNDGKLIEVKGGEESAVKADTVKKAEPAKKANKSKASSKKSSKK